MSSRSRTMPLDLNALRAYVLVVEAGGVAEAARRAGLPKSSLSRQVRDLEARLGRRLLCGPCAGLWSRRFRRCRVKRLSRWPINWDRNDRPVPRRMRLRY